MKLKLSIILIFCWLSTLGCSKGDLSLGNTQPPDSANPTSQTDKNNDDNALPNNGNDTETDDNALPNDEDDTGTEDDDALPNDEDDGNTRVHTFSLTQKANENKEVDIVMIIDNSGSMAQNHLDLRYRFNELFNEETLGSTDWQMAFLSSAYYGSSPLNESNGFYHLRDFSGNNISGDHQILSPAYDNYEELFINTISSRQGGVSSLGELFALMNMINHFNTIQNFFRKDALLAVIIISDELAATTGYVTNPETGQRQTIGITLDDIATAAQENFGLSKQFVNYGIILEPNDPHCQEASANEQVALLAQKTGGFTESICNPDYSSIMSNIGESIKKKLDFEEIPLPHESRVVEGSVELSFKPRRNKKDWKHEGNKIVFTNEPPAEGTKITIEYRYRPPQ